MSKVFLYNCNSYNNSKEAMDKIIASFDVLKDIKKGTKVVIKANLVSALSPEKAATTHPVLLKYLTQYLLDKGCSVVIGDSPGGVYTKPYLNHIYNVTKMNETGALLNDNFNISEGYNEKANVLKKFTYTSYVKEADVLINFCKLKTHGMMKMSCAVKNMFGTIPGTMKPEYHYRFPNIVDFANMLIDLNEFFKADVNIVDAIVAMEGNGPTMGTPRNANLLLASSNPYALDFICSKLIGLKPGDVETIKQSINRKLFDENNIELNDSIDKYIINDFEVKKELNSLQFFSNKKGLLSKLISKGSNILFSNKPNVKKNKCVGCQKCANICPMKAITMVNGKPKIDRSKCIKCYCCQEFCPAGAMVVKESIFMKILHFKKSKKH